MDKSGYAGKISTNGAQYVESPNKHKKPADKSVILNGNDLRASGSKKKG